MPAPVQEMQQLRMGGAGGMGRMGGMRGMVGMGGMAGGRPVASRAAPVHESDDERRPVQVRVLHFYLREGRGTGGGVGVEARGGDGEGRAGPVSFVPNLGEDDGDAPSIPPAQTGLLFDALQDEDIQLSGKDVPKSIETTSALPCLPTDPTWVQRAAH